MRGDTLLLGTRKGLLIYERKGSDWRLARVAHSGTPVAYAAVDPRNGAMWACLDHGHWGQKLSRSRDRGATWEELAAPRYPDGSEISDGFPVPGTERPRKPATLRYLWVFQEGGRDEPGRVYLGTEPGGLFVSNDDGASFELVRGLWDHPSRLVAWSGGGRDNPGIHSIVVDPRDSRHVLVAISSAGVFETRDGGATWHPRNLGTTVDYSPTPDVEVGQDVHCLVACPAAPDRLWQQNHFGIWRSDDGAANWIKVSQPEGPARFGFPIAVDECDPRTAWVVPAKSDQDRAAFGERLTVCRTTDAGATWTALRAGFPDEPTFDIVYRHALDLAGSRLALGSTTGNVYWSDDRGDSWRALSHHLPPVYSVRFA